MDHLPILQELFQSDGIVFFVIGIVLSIIIGFHLGASKKCIIGLMASFIVYVICEIIANSIINYMLTFLILFIGWIALGDMLGFAISSIRNNRRIS